MIEIQWATEIDEGNTIFEGKYCHEDCALYDPSGYCRAGYAIEDGTEDGEGYYDVPGPECPGPGCYKLIPCQKKA